MNAGLIGTLCLQNSDSPILYLYGIGTSLIGNFNHLIAAPCEIKFVQDFSILQNLYSISAWMPQHPKAPGSTQQQDRRA